MLSVRGGKPPPKVQILLPPPKKTMFTEYKPDKEGIFIPSLEIKEHPEKGFICVATEDFCPGALIERCLTIKFGAGVMKDLQKLLDGRAILHDYVFANNYKGYSYFALGYGGLYSHSSNPNAKWKISYHPNERETIDIRAIKTIKKGEEITISYMHKSMEDQLWFNPIDE